MDMPEANIPVMEACETSASREGINSDRVYELENEIMELKLLDRHIKTVNETLQRTSEETRDASDQIVLMCVKLEKRNIKLIKRAKSMYSIIKTLMYKLAPGRPKPSSH